MLKNTNNPFNMISIAAVELRKEIRLKILSMVQIFLKKLHVFWNK